MGSGTTLLEASLLGRTSIGVDNNAVATLVSRAKISQYTTNDLQALDIFCQNLPDARTLDISSELVDIPLYKELDGWFAAEATRDLGFIREQINGLKEPIQSLALATLSSIIVRVSYQDSDTRYTRVRKEYKSGSALKWYKQKLFQAIGGAREIANHSRAASSAHLADARKLSFVDDRSVDLIVTSPPYLNAYDYHKYHRHRLHWISGDVLLAREKEIGKHDTFTKKRAIPDPYFSDMYQCFSEWSRVIKPGGTVLIVIGDAIVSGVPVPVGDTFIELLTELGFVLKNRWVRTVKSARKSFNGRARIQKEHVLLFVYK